MGIISVCSIIYSFFENLWQSNESPGTGPEFGKLMGRSRAESPVNIVTRNLVLHILLALTVNSCDATKHKPTRNDW